MVEVNEKDKAIYDKNSEEWTEILGFITIDKHGEYIYYMGIMIEDEDDEYKFICFYKDMVSVPEVHNFNNGMSLEDNFNEDNYNENIIKIFKNQHEFEESFKFEFKIN